MRIEDSVAGLYLWCTERRSSWDTLQRLAVLGIIAGPGAFYGSEGEAHVRIALTASDERVAQAVERLTSAGQG